MRLFPFKEALQNPNKGVKDRHTKASRYVAYSGFIVATWVNLTLYIFGPRPASPPVGGGPSVKVKLNCEDGQTKNAERFDNV